MVISEETLVGLERLSARGDPAPWTAVVEGRDAESGDSFIRTGTTDRRGEDVYVTRDSGPAGPEHLDLIAAARTYLPLLVRDLREARAGADHPATAGREHAGGEVDAGPARLILIGYWAGPETTGDWPSPEDFVDPSWDADERSLVVDHLKEARVVRGFMGWSRCRMCGRDNGDLELSDGTYLWPSGLVHYVEDHDVRLPQRFVAHAAARIERLEQAERDGDWWRSVRPERRTDAPAQPSTPEIEDTSRRTVIMGDGGVPSGLVGREHVLRAVEELRQEIADGSAERWENPTLDRFLEAFGELLSVVERSYENEGRPVPPDPWVLTARALRGAREYE